MKIVIKYAIIIFVVLFSFLYYLGEERTREFRKNGFILCEKIPNRMVWTKTCPNKPNENIF